jgi:hypothetical protein
VNPVRPFFLIAFGEAEERGEAVREFPGAPQRGERVEVLFVAGDLLVESFGVVFWIRYWTLWDKYINLWRLVA